MKRRPWKALSFAERARCLDVALERAAHPESKRVKELLKGGVRTKRQQAKRLREFLAAKRKTTS